MIGLFKKKKTVVTGDEVTSADFKRILNPSSDFGTVEAYKSIRTNIMFSIPKQEGGKIIAVTGSIPGEGKTTTCMNLAITFAQTGAKVIVVDCDLRKSRVHRYFMLDRSPGVTNVICGYNKLSDCIRKNVKDNLDCLTAGEEPSNPAELLETDVFSDMIKELADQYDYIFIDTPPMTVVTDAAVVIRNCTGVVAVARENYTTFDALDVTVAGIKRTGTKFIGIITIGQAKKHGRYGYYKYGNDERYGYR